MASPTMTSRRAAPRRSRAVIACAAFAIAFAGCTDEGVESNGSRSSTTVPTTTDPTTDVSTTDAAAGSTTTAAEPVAPTGPGDTVVPTTTAKKPARGGTTTSLLPASTGLPPVLPKNSQGLDITLDETALLACAQDQIAWVALQGGQADEAATALGIAATRAEASAVADIKSSAATLRAAAASATPQAEVDRFLALCVTNGFEY